MCTFIFLAVKTIIIIIIIIIITISTTTKHEKICSVKFVLFVFIVQEICQKQIFFPAMNWTRLADDNFK